MSDTIDTTTDVNTDAAPTPITDADELLGVNIEELVAKAVLAGEIDLDRPVIVVRNADGEIAVMNAPAAGPATYQGPAHVELPDAYTSDASGIDDNQSRHLESHWGF